MKPKITINQFDPARFADLLMQDNVQIVEIGGFDLDDLEVDDEESHGKNKCGWS